MRKQCFLLYFKTLERNERRREKIMCAKLNELKGMSAKKILELAGQENAAPIDLNKVIKTLGLYKEARDFSDLEAIENKGKISGLVVLMGDDVKIFFNIKDKLKEKRFTAAHEIGHCCLHGDSLKNDYIEFLHMDGFENKHEAEASEFAARLLIPSKSLRKIHSALIEPTIEDLSNIFEVSERIMKIRLKEERLKVNY